MLRCPGLSGAIYGLTSIVCEAGNLTRGAFPPAKGSRPHIITCRWQILEVPGTLYGSVTVALNFPLMVLNSYTSGIPRSNPGCFQLE